MTIDNKPQTDTKGTEINQQEDAYKKALYIIADKSDQIYKLERDLEEAQAIIKNYQQTDRIQRDLIQRLKAIHEVFRAASKIVVSMYND